MNKFFRNIRQNLLNQGKTSKYFKYAIGEIVLVVIGILIALQINNWNEDRKNRSLEDDYLIALQEDLISDSVNVEIVRRSIQSHIDAAQLLIQFIDTGAIKDTISMKKAIIQAGFLYFFNPTLSTYNDLVNSGNLGIIKNKVLKDMMDNYVSWLNQMTSREEWSKDFVWTIYGNYYRANYLVDGRIYVDYRIQNDKNLRKYHVNWEKMRNDLEFKRLLTWVIAVAGAEKEWSDVTMKHILNIKDHIDTLTKDVDY